MRGEKQLKIAMMVRGYLPLPRPSDMIYAPIDLAGALAEGLTAKKHSVDFYGPLGSESNSANIVTRNLRSLATTNAQFQALLGTGEELNHYVPSLWDTYLAEEMFRRAQLGKYDVLHFQHPEVALPLAKKYRHVQVVYTLNDPIYPWYKEVFELYSSANQHFVSISNNQRRDAPDLNYAATIYNGIDTDDFSFSAKHEEYLLYTGRIVPEKGVREAIQVAQATAHRLLIVGPVPPASQGYFDQYIKPYLNDKVLYLGFIERDKILPYYQKAKALLVPIQWEEPFGLTSVEAMACGTPVIALSRGSMPEIIKNGKTGYVVNSVGEMIEAVRKINKIDRHACREHVKAHFSLRQMVEGYEAVYHQVLTDVNPVKRLQRKLSHKVQQSLDLTTKTVLPKRPKR